MSMHMIKGVQVHGKSKKKKLTAAQLSKMEVEWRQYNKQMRKSHMHSAQFKEFKDYLSYVRGEYKPKTNKEFKAYESTQPHVRNTKKYPSLETSNTIPGSGTRKESPKYTGDLIIGIGTMHKSNLVPIMRGTDQAKDIAKMRR